MFYPPLYSNIKQVSDRLRFFFITGISKYAHMSIFSGFNNIVDLSLRSKFGALLGYTQEELECYFGAHIEHAACVLNQKNHTDQYSYELVLQLLKLHYNGYCFDLLTSTLVYNPWSILNFLQAPEDGFQNYWADTGGAIPTILAKYLGQQNGSSSLYERFLDLDKTIEVNVGKLAAKVVGQNSSEFSFVPVLYNAGYFTIKSGGGRSLTLGIPNLEVKETISLTIMGFLKEKLPSSLSESNQFSEELKGAFLLKDFEKVRGVINELINTLTYDTVSRFNESSFRDFVMVAITFAGANNIQMEVPNAVGRVDLKFDVEDTCFVCEFKVDSNVSGGEAKLAEAERQIVSNKYASLIGAKNVVPLAIVAVNQCRGSKNNGESCDSAVRGIAVIKPVDIADQ